MSYAAVRARLLSWQSGLLLALAGAGLVALAARFWLGLGATTNLSDTYPWGLWIVIDLVWIALAAGAFTTAALVYLFGGARYHPIARAAVWMGLLSYSFVVVTLLADLGLPWHGWQVLVQRPEHSAMFEVAWCVALYLCVLGLEFAPALLERFGWRRLHDGWRRVTPFVVVAALVFFTYLMSHSLAWTGAALLVFGALAFLLRRPARGGVPILLVIAAVVFSTMHQSSLGSLFLLMPDKLSPLWWSPLLPVHFFFSAVAAGLAAMVLVELAIAKAFARPVHREVTAGLGRMVCGALWAYLAVRLADLVWRGQLTATFAGGRGALFWAEIVLGGFLPALLLARGRRALMPGALLAVGGVVLNRLNVVLLGMDLAGPAPGLAPRGYVPSTLEIVISVGVIAATVFLFALGAKLLPVLGRHETPAPDRG
ncbi:MAG: NrfD/PsrC family molybdoenzyme membrane anchor subunit [Planctomycetota bacterium]